MLVTFLVLVSLGVQGQEKKLGIYAPNLYFKNAEQKLKTLNTLNENLIASEKITAKYKKDLSSLHNQDFSLSNSVDFAYLNRKGFKSLFIDQQRKNVVLLLKKNHGFKNVLDALNRGNIALTGNSQQTKHWLRYWVLMGHEDSGQIIKRAKYSRDLRTAITLFETKVADGLLVNGLSQEVEKSIKRAYVKKIITQNSALVLSYNSKKFPNLNPSSENNLKAALSLAIKGSRWQKPNDDFPQLISSLQQKKTKHDKFVALPLFPKVELNLFEILGPPPPPPEIPMHLLLPKVRPVPPFEKAELDGELERLFLEHIKMSKKNYYQKEKESLDNENEIQEKVQDKTAKPQV